jgi:hypothetical protein
VAGATNGAEVAVLGIQGNMKVYSGSSMSQSLVTIRGQLQANPRATGQYGAEINFNFQKKAGQQRIFLGFLVEMNEVDRTWRTEGEEVAKQAHTDMPH